jgi:hypothetical protein
MGVAQTEGDIKYIFHMAENAPTSGSVEIVLDALSVNTSTPSVGDSLAIQDLDAIPYSFRVILYSTNGVHYA